MLGTIKRQINRDFLTIVNKVNDMPYPDLL